MKRKKKTIQAPSKYYFICSECLTRYETSVDEAPPGINWSDGHKCTPVKDLGRTQNSQALNQGKPADTNTY